MVVEFTICNDALFASCFGFAGWSFFRHNLTEERPEDLPQGRAAAAAMLLAANASHGADAAAGVLSGKGVFVFA